MPRIVVYSRRQFRPTAQPLSVALNAEYCEDYPPNTTTIEALVRYGNSNELRGSAAENGERDIERNCLVINMSRTIQLAQNKLAARRVLLEAQVPVPPTYDAFTYKEIVKFPVIARPFQHWQGRNFNIVNSAKELEPFVDGHHYFSEVINKDEEYRVFVFRGRIMEIDRKAPRIESPNPMIRNHRNGWRFHRTPMATVSRAVVTTAIQAVQSIGLTFGAVDVGYVTVTNKAYAFEVNSAPGLIQRKIDLLASKIKELMGE